MKKHSDDSSKSEPPLPGAGHGSGRDASKKRISHRVKHLVIGAPRDLSDHSVFHKLSLVPLMAWVGLGADGLSSSSYGPDEAFRALGPHGFMALGLAVATALTVFIISKTYSRIIEHFPYGGGGYIVASRLLGPGFGVLSGSALLVDYVLTVSVSIASCTDQVFSVLPPHYHLFKVPLATFIILVLVILNLRGVKESITVLAPIFAVFVITHLILILGGIGSHLDAVPRVAGEVRTGFQSGLATLGWAGMAALFFRAYSMGGGTYTGIEAVSNGLQIMREPKVETGKRTMVYMSVSLALTAAGILVCYLLFKVEPEKGKTMNAVLLERFAGGWRLGSLNVGHSFVVLTLAAEAALLFVGAQAGFIDGPRVMANMAIDSWLPRRFAQLSDRLTMQNGVLLMGGASILILFYTHGDITALVTMYSINVFLTFSLSQAGMIKYWIQERSVQPKWKSSLAVHIVGFLLCFGILVMVIIEKFTHGAWITLIITTFLIILCFLIRRHYRTVQRMIRQLDEILTSLPAGQAAGAAVLDPKKPTAVLLVGGYSGLGIHQFLQLQRLFPGQFKNFIFVSVGVVDSATMKGIEEVEQVRRRTEAGLSRYVELARGLGLAADSRMSMGTEAVAETEKLCLEIRKQFPGAIFFMGKLIFQEEHWYHRFLHNETAYQLQRRLHFDGLNAIVLTVRLYEHSAPPKRATAPAIS